MRSLLAAAALVATVFVTGCDKPSEEDCKRAVDNITKIYDGDPNRDVSAWVRKCRAQSTKERVKCIIDAKTKEDVEKCEAGEK